MNVFRLTLSAALAGALVYPSFGGASNILSLSEYMKQVTSQNETYKSNVIMINALKLREAQASLDFMPQLTGGYNYMDDRRLITELQYGGPLESQNASLGVQTKLRTGTLVNFGYTVTWGELFGNPPGVPSSGGSGGTSGIPGNGNPFAMPAGLGSFYSATPTLTLTQPLWKDFGAALSKSNEEMQLASDRAQAAQQRFSGQQVAFNAETAYWHLALSRQIIVFDEDSIDRTNKILERNRRRVAMNVADRSDLLQSEAALQSKQLQYQSDLQEMKTAANTFNSLRNVTGDQVKEGLQPIDESFERSLPTELQRTGVRSDVIAAEQNAISMKASARAQKEQVKPDISVYGQAQFSGLGTNMNQTMGESWNADNPAYAAGLKLTIPMDVGAVKKINEGYDASAHAADLVADRARFDLDQDWSNLERQFQDALARLKLAKELERVQGEKLKHERNRFAAGRTTSFQVLQFEEDYSQAQLSRIRIENELVTLRAQARLYNGEAL